MPDVLKPVDWISSSLKDLKSFPEEVRDDIGIALYRAQQGKKHAAAKPLQGFGGAGVLEVISDHDGDTYRAVYTLKFSDIIYVLHCFQKKSRSGISTPKHDIDLIKARLKLAEEDYSQWLRKQKST